MTEIMQVKVDEAKADPSKFFQDPKDVVQDQRFTREQKIEILHAWDMDARAMAVAEEENMSGGEPARLSTVVKALLELGDERDDVPSNPSAPTKADAVNAPAASGKQHDAA